MPILSEDAGNILTGRATPRPDVRERGAESRVRSLEAFCYRYPLATPVLTSFGTMTERPAVFVCVEDDDGISGWGEIWCNFPSVGAEHRARIANTILAPLVIGTPADRPVQAFDELSERTSVLTLQSGESGPFAQAIAGIDIALWDLAAKRAGQPLWRMLGGTSPQVKVYASGINPSEPERTVEAAQVKGHCAFKLKIGFDEARDRENVMNLRRMLGAAMLAVDANQAWSLETALRCAPTLFEAGVTWLEEPLRADRPWTEWRSLAETSGVQLAGGENLAGRAVFAAAIQEDVLRFVQPDIAKWGGFSGCAPVAREALGAGQVFCPHYLGGGIGLLASAHLLAGVGGPGLLEVDVNENPLREAFCGSVAHIVGGTITLSETSGLGLEPDLTAIETFRTL